MIKKKSLIICIFVSLFIILAILLYNLFNMFYKKTVFENDVLAFWNKNQKTIFSINKWCFLQVVMPKIRQAQIPTLL